MSDHKLQFSFNSALSPVNSETGAFEDKLHNPMALKIRGHIMSQTSGDGICGMHVARFGMNVDFIDEATTKEKVVAVVNETIAWAAKQEGFFPLRGNKTPKAILEVAPEKVFTGEVAILAQLKCDLYAHPVNEKLGTILRESFAKELVILNGVRDYQIGVNWVQLIIEVKVTSIDVAKTHIQQLLDKHAKSEDSRFLPFNKTQPVEIEWSTLKLMGWPRAA